MPKSHTTSGTAIAGAILCVGGLAYAGLCQPAIDRRGYPPIDPVWISVTHLWLAPILFSALFDSSKGKPRRTQLFVYAIATAFINAGTAHYVTPRYVDPLMMALGTLFPYGPVHLLGAFAANALMRFFLGPEGNVVAISHSRVLPRVTLRSWFAGFTLFCVTFGFPFAYRSFVLGSEQARGVSLAREHWESEEAVIFKDADLESPDPKIHLQYGIDPDTGLVLEHRRPDLGFCDAYNATIAALIEKDGPPNWSLRKHLPSPNEVVSLLDSDELEEVTVFPHEINYNIVLMRRGTISRWGSTSSSGSDSLSVATASGLFGVGSGVQPVFVRVARPIVSIRNGKNWVGVFFEDGRMIVSASRF